MGSGCRKTISWKNYYIKPKLRFLKTIFNFTILIFAAIMWVLRWCPPRGQPSSGHLKGNLDIPILRAGCPHGPLTRALWHAPQVPMCAQAGSGWPLTLMHEPQTLPYKLPLPSPAPPPPPPMLGRQRKMGPAHKFFLLMVKESKQVNKFLNAFLRPGIINTLSCYHD